jgi:TonB family protein
MKRRWALLAAAMAVATGGTAQAAAPAAAAAPAPHPGGDAGPVPLDALAEIPFISDPLISPDGKRIVAKVNSNGQEALAVYDLAAGPTAQPVFIDHPGTVRSLAWAGSDRVLVGCHLFTLMIGSVPLTLTRLVVFDMKTKKPVNIEVGKGFIHDAVIFTDPDGRYILLAAQKDAASPPSVDRVDLATGQAVEVQKRKEGVWSWFADGTGTIRGGIGYEEHGWTVYRRDPASGDVRKAATGKFDPKRETAIDSIQLLPAADTGIIVSNERTGRFGVYKFDLNAKAIGEPVFEDPRADVKHVDLAADGASVESVTYEDDKPRVVWFNAELKQIQGQIDRTFPGKVNRIVNYSRDRNVVLVWTGSADDPGAYYVFDRKARRMNAFAAPYEKLVDRKLGTTAPVEYKARDGLAIPGYLTLPPGRTAKNLPLILMPHGGPFARASYEFDPVVQMLATRGYAVLQPNFRGSTGFGRDFVERGYGQWGEAMQDDLDDGVAWLAGQGVIDPKRVCILGGSYGGYAALWGAIRSPDRYRCAVSFAGVTDIRAMLKWDSGSLFANRYFKQWRKKVEGEEKRDLASLSPLQQQERLKIPVLIAHGESDSNVPVAQSKQLVAALKARGAVVQAAFYPGEGHGFSASEDLLDYLRRVAAFLDVHNPADGGAAKGPREPELAGGKLDAALLKGFAGKKKPTAPLALALQVAADGRVTSCTVQASSGNPAVDKGACAYALEQLQYRPALAADGSAKEAAVTQTVRFEDGAPKK